MNRNLNGKLINMNNTTPHLKKANQLFQAGELDQALNLYLKIEEESPKLASLISVNIQLCRQRISQKRLSEYRLPPAPLRTSQLKKGFTVVSAVYGVEKYLNDYFNSVINQTIGFEENIHLILVDDGSLDNSAAIIKEWQAKYPQNITYLFKENGGQGSARNLGIEYVETEWVSFIDPDDFVDTDYFKNIDYFLKNNKKDLSMLSCPYYFYYEDTQQSSNTHPLTYKYSKGDKIVPLKELNENIQLSASTVLFKTEKLNKNNIKFDTELKPNFEDAKFNIDYLYNLSQDSNIAFIANAIYYYRKRISNDSTLDTAWQHPGKYNEVLELGYLYTLKKYKSKGEIPYFIKYTILYDLSWHIKYLVDRPERVSFLSEAQKQRYLDLLDEIFTYLDDKFILQFNARFLWYFYKAGILACFKKTPAPFQIVYIEGEDKTKQQLHLRYFYMQNESVSILADGIDLTPDFSKQVNRTFVTRDFIKENNIWVHIPSGTKKLQIVINGKKARISYAGKQTETLELDKPASPLAAMPYHQDSNTWLLLDRDTQADDNAEHLYRYIRDNHPEKNIYFALRSSSHDWERLKQEGFKLVDFGTEECDQVFNKAGKIISSHIDGYITNYFGKDTLKNKHMIFLQHGIIKDNLSRWLNSKKMQLFVTSTQDEFNSIVNNSSPYKFTKKEVVLTGLPRHDKLLESNIASKKQILIMPTWRNNLMGKSKESGNIREINDNFLDSNYAKHWRSLLCSKQLKSICEKYEYKILFRPHPNIVPYIELMYLPEHITSDTTTDYQTCFTESAIQITDYSSTAFEMALLNKSILYYQFDEEDFFSDAHTYTKGYFDYREDGFGPVVTEEEKLLQELEKILENEGKPLPEYQQRIDKTFCFKDTNNCQRVYNAILELDAPYNPKKQDLATAIEWTDQALQAKNIELATQRFQQVKNRI